MSEQKKDHILLVDDEKHLLISLRDCLTFENFLVTTARSGEEALEVLGSVNPDLIILDISMPGMGGLGFLKRISDAGGKPRFPVLVLTARAMLADFFKEVEVDGFIAKPCDEAELISIIRIILDKRKSAMMLSQRIKPQILLGEDERVIAEDLVRHFGKAGYDIEVAGSGPELLEKAARRRPSLVLTKEVLPRLNGSAVASLLDVMPSMSAVPVVLYDWTRSAAEMERMQSAKIRCIRQYLHTNDAEQLVATVNTVLAR